MLARRGEESAARRLQAEGETLPDRLGLHRVGAQRGALRRCRLHLMSVDRTRKPLRR